MTDPGEDDPFGALPPELAALLRSMMSGDEAPDLAEMFKGMGLDQLDPGMLASARQQFQAFMSPSGDAGVDAATATDVARKAVSATGERSVSDREAGAVRDAVDTARVWLDAVTEFPAHDADAAAWSRAEWVEATMPAWVDVTEPVARGVSAAITTALTEQFRGLQEEPGLAESISQLGLPAIDPAQLGNMLQPVLGQLGSAMFTMQLGEAVGALASDVLSGTEAALPLVDPRVVALLPAAVEEFADGLSLERSEVMVYLAVRESARSRLFGSVPWLREAVMAAVRDYSSGISIDTGGIEQAVAELDLSHLDLSNPGDMGSIESLQKQVQDSLFRPQPTDQQRATLARLEALLALIEGWVDVVTDRATAAMLPHAEQLKEAVRRRRASGGPAEVTFARLVGLELRPRRLRDASNLWLALEDRLGREGRDNAWSHPDIAPTAADLDDPLGYVDKQAAPVQLDDMDAELRKLLDDDAAAEAVDGAVDGAAGGAAGGDPHGANEGATDGDPAPTDPPSEDPGPGR